MTPLQWLAVGITLVLWIVFAVSVYRSGREQVTRFEEYE